MVGRLAHVRQTKRKRLSASPDAPDAPSPGTSHRLHLRRASAAPPWRTLQDRHTRDHQRAWPDQSSGTTDTRSGILTTHPVDHWSRVVRILAIIGRPDHFLRGTSLPERSRKAADTNHDNRKWPGRHHTYRPWLEVWILQ